MGWNRAKIAVWGGKQEAARHCRVAPSRRFVNMTFCTKMGRLVGVLFIISLNLIVFVIFTKSEKFFNRRLLFVSIKTCETRGMFQTEYCSRESVD